MPIDTYWTTNYDREIEKYLEKNNRKIDVKITEKNLATNVYNRSAVLYKMHGDVTFPEDAVITKDDYDKYNSKKSLFKNALIGDLIGKTFLFIGFSFKDPNIDHVLSQIKLLIGNHKRKHYCIMKKVDSEANSYDAKRQEFFEKDLERYGIYTIYIDKYDEITNILSDIEKKVLFNNIFISGSNAEEADELKLNKSWHDEKVRNEYFESNFDGDCLLAVGDEDMIKIHFHTNEPWKVLEYCSTLGEIYDIVVEDMDRQARGLRG